MLMRANDSFHDILKFYARAEPEDRAGYILNNFAEFIDFTDQVEDFLIYQIREEQKYNRRKERTDLGVRVQQSATSDPTADEAIAKLELEEAFHSGDMGKALRFTDDPDRHQWERDVISDMRRDFSLINGQIRIMRKRDQNLLMNFLSEETGLLEIAEEHHIQYESAKVKISRLKRKIRKRSATCIQEQYRFRNDYQDSLYEEAV